MDTPLEQSQYPGLQIYYAYHIVIHTSRHIQDTLPVRYIGDSHKPTSNVDTPKTPGYFHSCAGISNQYVDLEFVIAGSTRRKWEESLVPGFAGAARVPPCMLDTCYQHCNSSWRTQLRLLGDIKGSSTQGPPNSIRHCIPS